MTWALDETFPSFRPIFFLKTYPDCAQLSEQVLGNFPIAYFCTFSYLACTTGFWGGTTAVFGVSTWPSVVTPRVREGLYDELVSLTGLPSNGLRLLGPAFPPQVLRKVTTQ